MGRLSDEGLEGRQRQPGACQIVLDTLPHQGASQGGLALGNLLQAEPVTGQYVTVGILWICLLYTSINPLTGLAT